MDSYNDLFQKGTNALQNGEFNIACNFFGKAAILKTHDVKSWMFLSLSLFLDGRVDVWNDIWVRALKEIEHESTTTREQIRNIVIEEYADLIRYIPSITELIFKRYLDDASQTRGKHWILSSLITTVSPSTYCGYKLNFESIENSSDVSTLRWNDEEGDSWLLQTHQPNKFFHSSYAPYHFIDSLPTSVENELSNYIQVMLKQPGKDSRPIVETTYLIPKEYLSRTPDLYKIGFDYRSWEAIAMNNQACPECYATWVTQYGSLSNKDRLNREIEFQQRYRLERKSRPGYQCF